MYVVLPEYRVRLERVAPGERAISAPYLEDHGLRTKLGGEPDWIQGDARPTCPECQGPMAFIAQIDSIGVPFMFGDVGMIYVFYCCGQPAAVEQCY